MRWIRIAVAMLLLSLNTVVHCVPLLLLAVMKVVLPFRPLRRALTTLLTGIAESWIGVNNWMIDRLSGTRLIVEGELPHCPDGQVLVLANHQSWIDIPVLQRVFNQRLPLLRFFLKSQLIWVPVLGLAWWALDFPFMKRYDRETIARRPELAGRDIAATRRACEKFRDRPVAIMNFVEGTRFDIAKHRRQGSSFRHLLKPRSGGIAFVLDAMQGAIDTIVDVTLVYPRGGGELPALMAGEVPEVVVHVRTFPVPEVLKGGGYEDDPEFRQRFQNWLNEFWREKDARIGRILARRAPPNGGD
ncbi:acyltransferase [Wenzhouxiangella sp. XN79A]|uniref:acyltransferase n=1 Tax=Wenzhouxiangella sp. XN79A TaxID=2724193 RepID=UPI00144A79C8|nr:acyltransferase [Wenzhouxiangella sp. XN79A]NKI34527.1 acyltransferase [Wenzhouxiangella sp. XN79A]